MSASILEFFKSDPPPPKVVLLSDACFFVRSIPVDETATEETLAPQLELAIESLAPFPLTQLNYGHHWVPGSRLALVFACYRRRFTQDQVDAWLDAEWVAPAFCSVFGMQNSGPMTVLYTQGDIMSAVHWDAAPVPSSILIRALPDEPTEEVLVQTRDSLLREIGNIGRVIDLPQVPAIASSKDEDLFRFVAGSESLSLPVKRAALMDVRSHEDLSVVRAAKFRNVLYWRISLGCVAALLLLGLAEIGLGFGWSYQRTRKSLLQTQLPVVEKAMNDNTLAQRIDELATKRLLPFEMITALTAKKPVSIQFLRVTTTGMYSIKVEAQTTNADDSTAWKSALEANPAIESIDVQSGGSRNGITSLTVTAAFRPAVLKPDQSS